MKGNSEKTKKGCMGCLVVIILFIAFASIGGALTSNKNSSNNSTSSGSSSSSVQYSKEDVLADDEKVWNYVLPVINGHNDLIAELSNYSAENALQIYNKAKDFEDFCQTQWGSAPQDLTTVPDEYMDSCKSYIIVEQTFAESVMTFIDTQKTSDLSTVQDNIERCQEALSIMASNRGVYLSVYGNLTEEEITEIANNSGIIE